MKIKPILPFMLLLAATSSSEIIANSDLLTEASKHHALRPDQKKIVQGDKLFIKKHGLVCDKLKVGKLFVGGQLSFNNKGCKPLLAKGTKEKNLLNLRSTFCFSCDPELSCSLNNNCTTNGEPAVGCLNLTSSLTNSSLKQCSGAGIGTDRASVCISGTGCQSQFALDIEIGSPTIRSLDLTSNVQIEILIPIFFCLPFCDRPTLQATYDDNSCEFKKSICVKDQPINETPIGCPVLGHSVTTFFGTNIDLRAITRSTAFLVFTLHYQNCIGIAFGAGSCDNILAALNQVACDAQQNAVIEICKHANTLLKDACFDLSTEGQVL